MKLFRKTSKKKNLLENMFAPDSRFRQQLISDWEKQLQKSEKPKIWFFS